MSPILDRQKSFRRLGKLRMGETRTSNGKSRPAKLTHWRITSPSRDLIGAVAQVYGGEARPWSNPAAGGQEWEVYTDTDTVRVIVPAGTHAFSQWNEMWTGGGCQRRCDGFNQESGESCACPSDPDERSRAAAKGQACKPTTRLSVVLPDIPDIGTWMLESHGHYAAVEMGAAEELIRRVTDGGTPIPAQLRIEQRTAKRGNETRRYAVPVLELTTVTHNMITTGEVSAHEIEAPVPRALESAPVRGPVSGSPPHGVPAQSGGGSSGGAVSDGGEEVSSVVHQPGRPAGSGGTESDALEDPAPSRVSPRPAGPSQPPLPHEIEGGAETEEASDARAPATPSLSDAATIAMYCRDAGLTTDDERHAFLEAYSEGRYTSSKEVPQSEVSNLRAALIRWKRGELAITAGDDSPVLVHKQSGTPDTSPTPSEWNRDAWKAAFADVPGVGEAKFLKAARNAADQLGVATPMSLNDVTDPKLVDAMRTWLKEQR